jgi:hypothetical protein
MAYHPRIECEQVASFQTTRSRNSELWFVKCPELERAVLGYAARYSKRYEVKLYALAIEGNHIQHVAHFPKANRAQFMRDFNSSVARAIPRYQPRYAGGRFWARRYSAEYLPGDADIENWFFYTVLQPVNDGLVDDIRKYPGYNCFEDAIRGVVRKFKVVNWKAYNDAKRWSVNVSVDDFTEIHELRYARLPGYENLSQGAYAARMRQKLKERTAEALRRRAGKGAVGAEALKSVQPGAIPKKTKRSDRYDHRPRILSVSGARRYSAEAWYFGVYFDYRRCSRLYRSGDPTIVFPKGTYKPPAFTIAYAGSIA